MASPVEPLVLDYGIKPSAELTACSDIQKCFLCEQRFSLSEAIDDFLRHLLESHSLIIADVDKVPYIHRYVEYWGSRLNGNTLDKICIKMKDENEGEVKYYYMLCSVLPEDRQLRSVLQRDKLKQVLHQQQTEREDNSKTWQCLFCNELFTGNRSLVLNHMNEEHNFNIGHPDNLVNVETLLKTLHSNLEKLLCLYCEKTFKDKFTLKEHMRKKVHKRLNPKNKEYDQYYLVNYLELGKEMSGNTHKKRVKRRGKGGVVAYVTSPEDDSDAEEGWLEERDGGASQQLTALCLFCGHKSDICAHVFHHMAEIHKFDMAALKKTHKLTFYHQVKIINYIRRQTLQKQCMKCGTQFEDRKSLSDHMVQSGHVSSFVEDKSSWDQPEYYFPTYENDNLLSGLDCEEQDTLLCEDWVIPEDTLSMEETLRLTPMLKEVVPL